MLFAYSFISFLVLWSLNYVVILLPPSKKSRLRLKYLYVMAREVPAAVVAALVEAICYDWSLSLLAIEDFLEELKFVLFTIFGSWRFN